MKKHSEIDEAFITKYKDILYEAELSDEDIIKQIFKAGYDKGFIKVLKREKNKYEVSTFYE